MAIRDFQKQYNELDYLIGIDIGTSAVKGVLMSSIGLIVSRKKRETQILYLEDGHVQFDANQLYETTAKVINELVAILPEEGSVVGLCISSASGNTLLVSEHGDPMIPVTSWMDNQCGNEMETVFGNLIESQAHELVGWPLLPAFPLAHLSWLKCHQPMLLEDSAKICMSTEYVNFKLTGNWGIDTSTATTFYLQDQKAAKWHLPYLDKLGIEENKLPPIKRPGTVVGEITLSSSIVTGLSPGTPIVLGSFDHPSAARGAGVFEEGQLLLSCGTSWVGFFPLNERQKAIELNLLVDPFLKPEGDWGAMFSLPAIGTLVDKYVCKYISDDQDRYTEFSRLSSLSTPTMGDLIINPMFDDDFSKPERYEKEDIARAVMVGTAFLLKMKIDQLDEAGISFSSIIMVGGPSETHPWPQIVSDVLDREIVTINGSCAGAVGAAILAGVGIGLFKDEKSAFEMQDFPKIVRIPDRTANCVYQNQYRKFLNHYSSSMRE